MLSMRQTITTVESFLLGDINPIIGGWISRQVDSKIFTVFSLLADLVKLLTLTCL